MTSIDVKVPADNRPTITADEVSWLATPATLPDGQEVWVRVRFDREALLAWAGPFVASEAACVAALRRQIAAERARR